MKYLFLTLLLSASTAFADDIQVSTGPTVIRGPAEEVAVTYDHSLNRLWSIQEEVLYISSSTYDGYAQPAKWTDAARLVYNWHSLFIGAGGALSTKTDYYNGSCLNFDLVGGVHLSRYVFFKYEHISNAGLKSPNRGRDMPQIGFVIPLK